eukprot:scaffold4454_cov411-Prasinococcus_capsulatus_cf.AAC.7
MISSEFVPAASELASGNLSGYDSYGRSFSYGTQHYTMNDRYGSYASTDKENPQLNNGKGKMVDGGERRGRPLRRVQVE